MIWVLHSLLTALIFTYVPSEVTLEVLMDKYWQAKSANEKKIIVKDILKLQPPFQDVYKLLTKGKKYQSQKKGFIKLRQEGQALPPYYVLAIPETYSPENRYPMQIYLHGAASNMDPEFLFRYTLDTLNLNLLKGNAIYVFPTAWHLSPWWSDAQNDNLNKIIADTKYTYNIDENNIRLSGTSDGGTGSYYFANIDQTKFCSITPYIGSIRALTVLSARPVYLNNFANTPIFSVNAARDHIFKRELEIPYLQSLKNINGDIKQIMVDSSGHSMNWFPLLRDSINAFALQNPRNPFPDTLIWQTGDVNFSNRFRYLLIERLGKTKSNGQAKDINNLMMRNGKSVPAFDRSKPFGIVSVMKEGNKVDVQTLGVRQFKLLISPEHFDISRPIIVTTNGLKSFEAIITPDLKTLLNWNILDNDRTMLFASELSITVK